MTVADMPTCLQLYHDTLGLRVDPSRDGSTGVALGTDEPVLILHEDGEAPERPRGTTGLYHVAILLPDRRSLARTLRRLLQAGYPLEGAADHGVSEALYLADPEGNGLEIYADRPRGQWPSDDGRLRMVTDPLDVEGLMGELQDDSRPWAGLETGTRVGHVHLQVSTLEPAERFYREVLGFDLMQHFGGSAAFLSFGGYHHHIGLNTWAGIGAPRPPAGSRGLRALTLWAPNETALETLEDRLSATLSSSHRTNEGLETRDPSGNVILLAVPQSATAPAAR
jgi:catechol 2,3-dioxygenase